MILYLHGFGGSGLGKKVSFLREVYKDKIFAPSLSNIPELAVDTLEQSIEFLLKSGENVQLIGSSIGGYLSIYLANKYQLKAVLINPAIYPYKMSQIIGYAKNFFDYSTFECTPTHLESLKKYELLHVKHQENFMLLLQKGDKILNYQEALQKLPNATLILEENGSHEFDNFENQLPQIENFFNIKT